MDTHLFQKIGACMLLSLASLFSYAEKLPLQVEMNLHNGAINQLKVEKDKTEMNWLIKTDGTQYPWVREDLAWGLGYFTLTQGHESVKKMWNKPVEINSDGTDVVYREGDIRIQVKRIFQNGDLTEEYTFSNEGKEAVSLYDIGIYTPFNDNYPGAEECI